MAKWTVGGLTTVIAALVLFTNVGGSPVEQTASQARDIEALHSSFVIVNHQHSGEWRFAIYENTRSAEFGGRKFLVGEYATDGDWKGVTFWIPVEYIEGMLIYKDRESAEKTVAAYISHAARRAEAKPNAHDAKPAEEN